MDITALSTISTQSQLMSDISIAVLSQQLDAIQESGDHMIKMMEQSVHPHIGTNIDITL